MPLHSIQRAKFCIEINLSQMSSWPFDSLSLSDGHLRRLQIIIVRLVMLSSSCYHLPSEYGTRSGGRSDVRKGVASLTEYTTYSKHSIDALTDVTVEIH